VCVSACSPSSTPGVFSECVLLVSPSPPVLTARGGIPDLCYAMLCYAMLCYVMTFFNNFDF